MSDHPPPTTAAEPIAARALGRVVDVATALGMALSALGVLASLVLITYAVVLRYGFNAAPTWVDDTVGFMLVGIVMLAAPATMRKGGHISVDMLTGRLGPAGRRWTEIWSTVAMLAVALILIVNGLNTALSSRMLGISTSGTVEIPIYLLQLLLPLGGALMLLVTLEAILRLALRLPSLAEPGHGSHAVKDEA